MNLMPSFPAVLSAALPQADLNLALGEGELPNSNESNSISRRKAKEFVFMEGRKLPQGHSGAPGLATGEHQFRISNVTAYQTLLSEPCCLQGHIATWVLSSSRGLRDFQAIPTAVQPAQLPRARLPPCTSLGSVLSLLPPCP